MTNLLPHQIEAVTKIHDAFLSHPAFLLADEMGVMKTRTACEVAKSFQKVLIIAPLSTLGGWESEAEIVGLQVHTTTQCLYGDVILINYDKLSKFPDLLNVEWDLVIADECQKLKSTDTGRWKTWCKIKRVKTLFLSATPAQSPLEMAYLKEVIGFKEFWPWVRTFEGIWQPPWGGLKYRPNIKDHMKLKSIVSNNPRALRRTPADIAGWPEIQRVMFPIKLTAQEAKVYESAMEDYLETVESNHKKNAINKVYDLVAIGQFRKSISLLRVRHTVELAKELLDQGKVVTIACEYRLSAQDIASALRTNDRLVATITGDTNPLERKMVLQASAQDKCSAYVFTVEEGNNLQQMKDEHRPRVQIDHDLQWSGLAQTQIDGRTHRAGRSALIYWMVCAGTVDERIAKVMMERMKTIDGINGDEKIDPLDFFYSKAA